MLTDSIRTLLIVCPLVFLSGFVDAIAGGGGLISMPAYLLAGLPVHVALGTNKFAATIGGMTATYKYYRTGNMKVRPALVAGAASLVAAWCGARLVLLIDERILKILLMACLPLVAAFLLTRKTFGTDEDVEKGHTPLQTALLSGGIGLVCGLYDGMIGPGTGTFLLLLFTGVLGYGLITSSGCAKLVNLASSIGSFVAYFFGGKVLFAVAIPAALSSALGSYLGARSAIKGGAKFIRPVIFLVLAMLFLKVGYDFLAG